MFGLGAGHRHRGRRCDRRGRGGDAPYRARADPKEATIQAMKEVSAPVIGIALILSAVFVPVAFVGGLTGQMYKQFALTIAISVLLSAFNALSLAPALAAHCCSRRTISRCQRPAGIFLPAGFNQASSIARPPAISACVTSSGAAFDPHHRHRRRGGRRRRPFRRHACPRASSRRKIRAFLASTSAAAGASLERTGRVLSQSRGDPRQN